MLNTERLNQEKQVNDNAVALAGRVLGSHVDSAIRAAHSIPEDVTGDELVILLASDAPGEDVFLDLRDRAEAAISTPAIARAAGVPESMPDSARHEFVEAARRWETLLCAPIAHRERTLGIEIPARWVSTGEMV